MSHVIYVDFGKKERIRTEIDLTQDDVELPAAAKTQTLEEKQHLTGLVEEAVYIGKGVRDGTIVCLAWATVDDQGETNHGWASNDSSLMWAAVSDLHADYAKGRLEEAPLDSA